MNNTVIEFNNVGKQYILGMIGTGTLSQDLNRWWANIRGKEDPFLKIGDTNDRTKKGDSRFVWALRDISFNVEQGDVVGIVGKNGAGKSTLLKILSRVTSPTTSDIKIKGRIYGYMSERLINVFCEHYHLRIKHIPLIMPIDNAQESMNICSMHATWRRLANDFHFKNNQNH